MTHKPQSAAVVVLPERVNNMQNNEEEEKENAIQEEQVDFNKNKKAQNNQTPQISELLSYKNVITGWAMRKGDTFFQPNKKRFIILSDNYLFWCMNEHAQYPLGGLNLQNKHVYITRHGTTLRVKSSNKERIFNFGDVYTASKFYDAMIVIRKQM